METNVATAFGTKVREAREARGWSQDKLARELDLHHNTVAAWELGKSEPRLTQFMKVAEVFRWRLPSSTRMFRFGGTQLSPAT